MKGKHKKSCNRFDLGGVISQQVLDLYRNSGGNGIAGAISTSTNATQKQANSLVKSGYNFNPMASNNDELMDVFATNRGVNHIGGLNSKDRLAIYGNSILSDMQTGSAIGGQYGALAGILTGAITGAIQDHNISKDIESTNYLVDELNKRQSAANTNAANNLATMQKLGFEAGYFRDGGPKKGLKDLDPFLTKKFPDDPSILQYLSYRNMAEYNPGMPQVYPYDFKTRTQAQRELNRIDNERKGMQRVRDMQNSKVYKFLNKIDNKYLNNAFIDDPDELHKERWMQLIPYLKPFRDGGDINYFNNGGTHEQNPFGGIPQGMAPNNRMNVVEEGEVKWESPDGDYIFSNHQRLNKQDVTDNLLPNYLTGKTIADAAKRILKESDERPYDYISTNGKDHFLNILRDINESKNPQNQEVNSFRLGGMPETETEDGKPAKKEKSRRLGESYKSDIRPGGLYIDGGNGYRIVDSTASGVGGYSGVRGKGYAFQNSDNVKEEVATEGTPSNRKVQVAGSQAKGAASGTAVKVDPAKPKSTTPVTSGGETPQAAAGETAPEEKTYDFGPAFTDPFVTRRSSDIVHNALKNEGARYKVKTDSGVSYERSLPQVKIGIKRDSVSPTDELRGFDGKKFAEKLGNAIGKIGDTAIALAPAFAAAFDNPNYNYANEMRNSFRPVDTPYVSSANYMKYTPIDLDYIFNQINRQSQNNMRNIMDLSGGNRATAMAGLSANDFSTQAAKSNAIFQTDLQNMQNYQNVQKHNTGINEFDINQYTTNARFNAQGLAEARKYAAIIGQQEYDAWKDREYANFSQALTNLQNLKKEGWTNDQIQMLIDSGAIAWDPRTGKYTAKIS